MISVNFFGENYIIGHKLAPKTELRENYGRKQLNKHRENTVNSNQISNITYSDIHFFNMINRFIMDSKFLSNFQSSAVSYYVTVNTTD